MASIPVWVDDHSPRQLWLDPGAKSICLTNNALTTAELRLDSVAFIRSLEVLPKGDRPLDLVSVERGPDGAEGWGKVSALRIAVPAESELFNHPAIKTLLVSPSSTNSPVAVISNAFAGARGARQVIDRLIRPLLDLAGVRYSVHETKAEGDAGAIAAQLFERGIGTIILAGGDGTVGEVVNGLLLGDGGELAQLGAKVGLVVV